jgi:beta-glucosidase-like glycosyl hydrolase
MCSIATSIPNGRPRCRRRRLPDCFASGSVSAAWALRQAIVAGVDIITFANNNPRAYEPDIAPRAINIIAALVEDGTISEARIDESVGRIRALKQRLSR